MIVVEEPAMYASNVISFKHANYEVCVGLIPVLKVIVLQRLKVDRIFGPSRPFADVIQAVRGRPPLSIRDFLLTWPLI
jgi:hypothetical protein